MNEKRFILVIFSAIALTLIISIIDCINAFSKNATYTLNVDNEYSEESALKAQQSYDTSEMKDEFVQTFEEISAVLSSKLLDGTITDEQALRESIKNINKTLSSNDWSALNLNRPVKWIGTWYLNDNGFLKFKFSSKAFEPSWVNQECVSEYIVLS